MSNDELQQRLKDTIQAMDGLRLALSRVEGERDEARRQFDALFHEATSNPTRADREALADSLRSPA